MNRTRWELELLEGLWWRIASAIQDYASCRRQVAAITANRKERKHYATSV